MLKGIKMNKNKNVLISAKWNHFNYLKIKDMLYEIAWNKC